MPDEEETKVPRPQVNKKPDSDSDEALAVGQDDSDSDKKSSSDNDYQGGPDEPWEPIRTKDGREMIKSRVVIGDRGRRRYGYVGRPRIDEAFAEGWQQRVVPGTMLVDPVWQLEKTKKLKIGATVSNLPGKWESVIAYIHH